MESTPCGSRPPEQRSLPALLAPRTARGVCSRLSRNNAKAKDLAVQSICAVSQALLSKLKIKYQDIEVGMDFDPEPGLADNGDLEHDRQALLEAAGMAAQKAGTALALFIDELQYVKEEQLAALITVLHRAAQRRPPVVLVGAGLPQLRGQMGRASPMPNGSSIFRKSGLRLPPRHELQFRSRPRNAASRSPKRRSITSCWKLMAIHTSSRNGASMPGTLPRIPQSIRMTSGEPQ